MADNDKNESSRGSYPQVITMCECVPSLASVALFKVGLPVFTVQRSCIGSVNHIYVILQVNLHCVGYGAMNYLPTSSVT
jgi:hypothetical protein